MINILSIISVAIILLVSLSLVINRFLQPIAHSTNYFRETTYWQRAAIWICANKTALWCASVLIVINFLNIYSRYLNYEYWNEQQMLIASSPEPGTIVSTDQELNKAFYNSYTGDVHTLIQYGNLLADRVYDNPVKPDYVLCVITYIANSNQYMLEHGYNAELDANLDWFAEIDNPSVQAHLERAYASKDKWKQ